MRAALRSLIVGSLALWMGCSAVAAPPLWRVRGPRGTAVLFGSVHMLPSGVDWRTPALSEALARADELWFEIPIGGEDDVRAAKRLGAKGRLAPGDRLDAHLPPEMMERVRRDATKLGIEPSALSTMRPWMADAMLSLASDMRSGAAAAQGVERKLDALVAPSVKRRSLETAASQIAVLAGSPPSEEVALLRITLDEIETRPDRYQTIVDAWVAGDLARLEAEALRPLALASPRAYDALIVHRNQAWTRILERRLARPGAIVVVVGVGHLIGAQGVPALLTRAGEAVTPPDSSLAIDALP